MKKFLLIIFCLFYITINSALASYPTCAPQEELIRREKQIIKDCHYGETLTKSELSEILISQKNKLNSTYSEELKYPGRLKFEYYTNGVIKKVEFLNLMDELRIDYYDVHGHNIGTVTYEDGKIIKAMHYREFIASTYNGSSNNSSTFINNKYNQIGNNMLRYNGDKICQIGDMQVRYNGDKICQIGDMQVRYNGDKICQIGDMQVRYNGDKICQIGDMQVRY